MTDLITELLEEGAFNDFYADCPECLCIEDPDYTCTTCWSNGKISVGTLIKEQQSTMYMLAKKLQECIAIARIPDQDFNNDEELMKFEKLVNRHIKKD